MTGTAKFAAATKRNADGFTLLELITVVAILGILAVMAIPSITRMLQQQETKSSATEMAGLLSDARSRAVAEGTPYLVYFNPPSVDGTGTCGAAAVEVRDADHSYSITDGDQTREFHLPASACTKVTPFSAAAGDKLAAVPMPVDDLAVRAPDASLVGAVSTDTTAAVSAAATTVGGAAAASGSGSSGSGSSSSGEDSGSSGDSSSVAAATTTVERTSVVSDTVVNGATFPVDAVSGRPVVAFSERGIPVDPAAPNAWGAGAGGIYLTDGDSTVYAALVQPLGDVQLRGYDAASGTWK